MTEKPGAFPALAPPSLKQEQLEGDRHGALCTNFETHLLERFSGTAF